MQLFIVRHAIAELREEGLPDETRALTPKGRKRFARVVRGLRRMDVRLDLVCHSPWRRAAETAEMLEPICGGSLQPTELLCQEPTTALLELLQGDSVAVVGHEPWTSQLVSLLLAGTPTQAANRLRKGGVAWLEGEPKAGGMTLCGYFPPAVFDRK